LVRRSTAGKIRARFKFYASPVTVEHAAIPSMSGVSVLAAISLLFQPGLSALLAGVLAGMGVASLVVLYGIDGRLYLDPRTGGVFRRE
jgi:hypothetical protein